MDFKKTFDKVAQEKLLGKLHDFSIGGKLLNLLGSYIRERKQSVKVKNGRSKFRNVTSGVPQGSILGPLFFIAYVRDLPRAIDNFSSYGYANDFRFIMESKTDANWFDEKIQTWSKDNHMSLNVEKSKTLCLKGSASFEAGDSLEVVSQQKDLGVIISRNLSWSDNCSRRTTKAWRSFWFLKRNSSHKANPVTKLNAYFGYVVPVLTYASQVCIKN